MTRITQIGRRLAGAILFCLLAPVGAHGLPAPDAPMIDITASLAVRWGDSPVDESGRYVWLTDPGSPAFWFDPATAKGQQPADFGNVMWTRFTIPDGTWSQPVLYLPQVLVSFELYADTTLIFRHGDFEPSAQIKFSATSPYLIPLPADIAGKTLSCRIYSPLAQYIGITTQNQTILVGQHSVVLRQLFIHNLDRLILGSLFFFAGLFSLIVFLRRLRHRIWYLFSFALLACNIGVFYVVNDTISGLMGIPPQITYYLGLSTFVAFPVGIYTFLEQITGRHRVLRRLWQLHILYLAVALPLDLLNIVLLAESGSYYSIGFTLSIFIGLVIVIQAMLKGSRIARVFGVGFIIFSLTGIHDLLAGIGVIPLTHWLSQWGMLVLILDLAYILEHIYSDSLRQLHRSARELRLKSAKLEEYSATLEDRVADRTLDLAAKNEDLVETMLKLKDAQAKMLVQDKMASLGNLVAGVAHEMNTPMGAMISAADVEARCIAILDREIAANPDLAALRASSRFQKARKSLLESNRLLNTGSQRITAILASLRSFARLDEASFQEVDLHEGLDSTLTLVHHELKNRVEVVRDFGTLPRVACSANQINQVFMNLLVNAAQAIEGQGTITIRTEGQPDEAVIRISDTGVGIGKQNLKHIFDPGYTTKGVGVGTGLGLSICYKILESHGGRITVDSVVGQGTTFEIRLPVRRSL